MTRKDYVAIAAVFKSTLPIALSDAGKAHKMQWVSDVENMAHMLATENPRFDRERFLTACGVQS